MDATNRAILLTPSGSAALAVVRLVGPAVGGWLKAHFSGTASPGRCVHGTLAEGERVIDDPVVVLSQDGRWADVNVHGGPWVVRSVLEMARRAGFEVDERPGLPLPSDAVDAEGGLEQEVLAHLPLAKTEAGVRLLLAQPEAWRGFKSKAAQLGRDEIETPLKAILADRSLHYLLHPPRVAIIGPPNAGKSTLANQLFAQERSITADLPGTTRDWVGEMANLDGLPVLLVDTPGYRETNDAIERQAIERSREQVGRADLTVLVLDASRALEDGQDVLIHRYPQALRVINKCDRPAVWNLNRIAAIRTIATDALGVEPLRRAIRAYFGCENFDPNRPRCWTERQQEILQQGLADMTALEKL